MQTVSLEQSVAMIPDGASLMIGGFMGVGTLSLRIRFTYATRSSQKIGAVILPSVLTARRRQIFW
jgi:hypothetical protein